MLGSISHPHSLQRLVHSFVSFGQFIRGDGRRLFELGSDQFPDGDPAIDRVATLAARRGFIAVSVDLYSTACELLRDVLRDRALLLVQGPDASARTGHAVLMDAAARSSRGSGRSGVTCGRTNSQGYTPT